MIIKEFCPTSWAVVKNIGDNFWEIMKLFITPTDHLYRMG